jgi:SAM-dependent methyltransferase
MHDTAMEIGAAFFNTYLKNASDLTIVDIGSQDVNGSLRSVAPKNNRYIGLDFEEGKGVDLVITDPYSLPFDSESIDVAVSSSCFEHSEFFWLLFNESLRILKPAGLLYINAPANGWYHRFPVDCWRFYPDSGVALQNWGKRSGYNCGLLESFVGMRKDELWNDFTAVFVKDEVNSPNYLKRIQDSSISFENGRRYGSEDIINYNLQSQDQDLLRAEKEARAADRDSVAAEIVAITAGLEAAISERDAVIAERDAITIERDSITAERNAVAIERDSITAEKDAATAGRDAVAAERDAITSDRNTVIAERDEVLRSRAWRITAPLRYLRRLQIQFFALFKL